MPGKHVMLSAAVLPFVPPSQVGDAVTIADVAVAAVLLPLLTAVLSAEARARYPKLTQWFAATAAQDKFAKVLGECLESERRTCAGSAAAHLEPTLTCSVAKHTPTCTLS